MFNVSNNDIIFYVVFDPIVFKHLNLSVRF